MQSLRDSERSPEGPGVVPCKDFVVGATSWRVATLVATNRSPAEPRRRNADLNEGEHDLPSNLDFHVTQSMLR